jgi:hypothetical protein
MFAVINKSVARTAVILLLISLSIIEVKVVDANPIPWAFNPQMSITILSPENETISALPVLVNFSSLGDFQFSVSDDLTQEWVRSFFYVLDGQNMNSIGMRFVGTNTTTIHEQGSKYGYNFSGQAYIANLTDGPHTISVYYGAVNKIDYVGTPQEHVGYNSSWQATSQFYVDSKLVPSLAPTQTPKPNTTYLVLTPTEVRGIDSNMLSNTEFIMVVIVKVYAWFWDYF